MKHIVLTFLIGIALLFNGCQSKRSFHLSVGNTTDTSIVKTVEIKGSELLNKLDIENPKTLLLIDESDKIEIPYQIIDTNKNGKLDGLIFQINLKQNQTKNIRIETGKSVKDYSNLTKVYAKFVPERKDDFAWENDRIAFRMYGPALEATGEISNGIDVWVKSTKELILDKWYKGEDYHTDHGEGLDYYKVGPSLGCGGSALMESDTLNKSKNFVNWKLIANGPIRTMFQLSYAHRKYNGAEVTEVKRISLDAGENLNKVQVTYNSKNENLIYKNVIGIVKHPGLDSGKVFFDKEKGIFAYWEPTNKEHGNTAVGVLVNPKIIDKLKETNQHYLIVLKPTKENSFSYYTGAAWNKSGDFKNFNEWKNYLSIFNTKIKL